MLPIYGKQSSGSSSWLLLSFSSLVCPWLIGLRNEKGVCLEEGCREQGLRTPLTAGSCAFYFFSFFFFFHLNPLFGRWWLIAGAPDSGILAPLTFHGCFLFLEAYFSSKQHARWLCDFQGAIQEGTYLPPFSLNIFSLGIGALVSVELRACKKLPVRCCIK